MSLVVGIQGQKAYGLCKTPVGTWFPLEDAGGWSRCELVGSSRSRAGASVMLNKGFVEEPWVVDLYSGDPYVIVLHTSRSE